MEFSTICLSYKFLFITCTTISCSSEENSSVALENSRMIKINGYTFMGSNYFQLCLSSQWELTLMAEKHEDVLLLELQIRVGIDDNSKISFLISQPNLCCDPSLEPSYIDGSNEGSQNMFLRRNVANYPKIICYSLSGALLHIKCPNIHGYYANNRRDRSDFSIQQCSRGVADNLGIISNIPPEKHFL